VELILNNKYKCQRIYYAGSTITILEYAIKEGNPKIVKLLIDYFDKNNKPVLEEYFIKTNSLYYLYYEYINKKLNQKFYAKKELKKYLCDDVIGIFSGYC